MKARIWWDGAQWLCATPSRNFAGWGHSPAMAWCNFLRINNLRYDR